MQIIFVFSNYTCFLATENKTFKCVENKIPKYLYTGRLLCYNTFREMEIHIIVLLDKTQSKLVN